MKTIPVKTLAHLKHLLQVGAEYRIIAHTIHPEYIGMTRIVSKVQYNAVYCKIKGQPNHRLSLCNNGLGVRTDFEKASQYEFGETVKVFSNSKDGPTLMYEFEVLEPTGA